jgi:hypothetical protein
VSADRWIRACDQERDRVAEVLSDAYAVGRLTREELDERSGAAFSARTRGELHDLTADLPARPADPGLPAGAASRRGTATDSRQAGPGQMIWTFAWRSRQSAPGRPPETR